MSIYIIILGNDGESILSPWFSLTSGKGGDTSPFLLAKVASSPTNLTEKALLLFGLLFPGAPWIIEKLKAIRSPGFNSHEAIS